MGHFAVVAEKQRISYAQLVNNFLKMISEQLVGELWIGKDRAGFIPHGGFTDFFMPESAFPVLILSVWVISLQTLAFTNLVGGGPNRSKIKPAGRVQVLSQRLNHPKPQQGLWVLGRK